MACPIEVIYLGVPVVICVFAAWGGLWYRVGKLAGEVKEHNKKLDAIIRKFDINMEQGGTQE